MCAENRKYQVSQLTSMNPAETGKLPIDRPFFALQEKKKQTHNKKPHKPQQLQMVHSILKNMIKKKKNGYL